MDNPGQDVKDSLSRSIDLYIERHANQATSSQVMPDLQVLQNRNFLGAFESSLQNGLTEAQVQVNGQKYGRNVYAKKQSKTLKQIFMEAICDDMLVILMIAAVVSMVIEFFFGEEKDKFWVEGVSILVAVMICTIVATVSNYQKEKQFEDLDKMTEATYNYSIIRDGKRQQIHRNDIVPGDIIRIQNGLEVPADSILIKSINVIVNESSITGESIQIYKNVLEKCLQMGRDPYCPSPVIISGSTIVSGEGLMMAVIVGKQSRIGKNFEMLFSGDEEDDDNKTPLERQLDDLANKIGYFGLYSAIFIFIVLVIRMIFQDIIPQGFQFGKDIGKVISYLIIAVTIIVVAIPEGLPLAVTLTLAFSMGQMHKQKILVRKLASCETMGAAHYVCTDKTGTLTQNKMKVMKIMVEEMINQHDFVPKKLNPKYSDLLIQAIYHNSSAFTDPEKGPQTEIALLKMANKMSEQNQIEFRKKYEQEGYFLRIPFNSSRKRMTTGITLSNENYIFSTGASEKVLQSCQSIFTCHNGEVKTLTSSMRQSITNGLQKMASQGLRTVAIGFKKTQTTTFMMKKSSNLSMGSKKSSRRGSFIHDDIQQVEKDGFILLGIFGIEDMPRPESKDAVLKCQHAGIKVVMITGDNKTTARKIAQQVAILQEGHDKVMQGHQFMDLLRSNDLIAEPENRVGQQREEDKKNKLDSASQGQQVTIAKIKLDSKHKYAKFKQISDGLAVLARSKPEHKYLLVDGLNKIGNIVGVTGDGANDAPALKRADIGLAMGITGTQVAKNASDIIILDDRFDSIVRAIVWGRNVYLSIRKFLQFQLTVNLVAVGLSALSAALIRQSVLTAVQMLWVNLIMDSLAALALATEPPNHDQLLKQKPNSPSQSLLTMTMIKHIIGQSIFQLGMLIALLFLGPQMIPEESDSFDSIIGSDLEAKYWNGEAQGTIADGKFYTIGGQDLYKVYYDKYHVASRHLTFIFNTFVFMQVFNFFCCRRISDQLWIFANLFSSFLFWIIVMSIVVLEVIIVEFLSQFFHLYHYGGLTTTQWILSVGIAALTIPLSLILRLLPICKPNKQIHNKE